MATLQVVLRTSAPPEMIFIALGIIIIVALYKYFNSKKQIVNRAISTREVTPMKDVKSGDYVRIQGEIVASGEVIRAPLTGRKCVYYSVKVVKRMNEIGAGITLSNGRPGSLWSTIVEDEMMADVIIKDGDYYAILDCDQPKAYLVPDRNFESGFMNEAPKVLERYLNKYGHSSTNLIGNNVSTKYEEGVLETGEKVVIKGHAYWVDAKQLKAKFPVEKVLVIRETEEKPIYISDDPDMIVRK